MFLMVYLPSFLFIVNQSSVSLFSFDSISNHVSFSKPKYWIDWGSRTNLLCVLSNFRQSHVNFLRILPHILWEVLKLKMCWKCVLQLVSFSILLIKFDISYWRCVRVWIVPIYWWHFYLASQLVSCLQILLSHLVLVV